MREVLPGVFHWRAMHPHIRTEVSSYWLGDEGVLIDPMVPPDVGLQWFGQRAMPPKAILLSNRHHYRDSASFNEAFGCPVYCNRAGLHEFTAGEPVSGFDPGDALPGGVLAESVGAICPDDTALYLRGERALAFADGLVCAGNQESGGELGFVADSLMDDPPATKQALLAAFARLLEELDFDHLLLAHGGAIVGEGRARLQELVDSGGRSAFEP